MWDLIPGLRDHDLSQNQESDTQPSHPLAPELKSLYTITRQLFRVLCQLDCLSRAQDCNWIVNSSAKSFALHLTCGPFADIEVDEKGNFGGDFSAQNIKLEKDFFFFFFNF